MPQFPAARIVQVILDSVSDSGASGVLVSSTSKNPRKFIIQSRSEIISVWVYIWTLTHGGGAARPKDEFRIQITGIQSPLLLNPEGETLLLGYEPNLSCFGGFDIEKHITFTGRSPSIQIPINVLNNALQDGFSFVTKGNNEIAVSFRSSEILSYILNYKQLHRLGADTEMVSLLSRAASLEEIPRLEMVQITPERQRIVTTVERLARDTSFRRKITTAYDNRCAVTRMQLRLVDAAHIVPVGVQGSTDEVNNGICLNPTYHRAFDRSLIYLDEDLTIRINPKKDQELLQIGLDGGLPEFKSYLGRRIHLPADRNQWPSTRLIRMANNIRKIT